MISHFRLLLFAPFLINPLNAMDAPPKKLAATNIKKRRIEVRDAEPQEQTHQKRMRRLINEILALQQRKEDVFQEQLQMIESQNRYAFTLRDAVEQQFIDRSNQKVALFKEDLKKMDEEIIAKSSTLGLIVVQASQAAFASGQQQDVSENSASDSE